MHAWLPLVAMCSLVLLFAYGTKKDLTNANDISLPDNFINSIFYYPFDYQYFLDNVFGITVAHLRADKNVINPDSYTEIINFNFDDILNCFAIMSSNDTMSMKDFIIGSNGEQWKLIKRVIQEDGEYWTSTFKNSSLTYKYVMGAIYQGGYSLYVIGLHNILKKMETLANYIQSILPDQKYRVGINLYLTPQGENQAFEVHMDYMDGLILQVAGCKKWRIYDPKSYPEDLQGIIPTKDNMIKPDQKQMNLMTFAEYELRKGDVLYIPKGTLHEAATNCTLDRKEETNISNEKNKTREPSVHLTIGIEDTSLMQSQRFDL